MTLFFDNARNAPPSAATLEKICHLTRSDAVDTKEAYTALYALVGAKTTDHFLFTSSGDEAINHVAFAAYIDIARKTGKNHFVTSSLGEAAAILAFHRLQELGCTVDMAHASPDGCMTVEMLREAITPRTALLSLPSACALTGVIQPLDDIATLCQERGIMLHVDATHTLASIPFSFEDSGIDILTFDGAPLHAPRGTGGLFWRHGISLSPLILGFSEQSALRGGSIFSPLLGSLGSAAQEIVATRDFLSLEMARLRDLLEEEIAARIRAAHPLFREQNRLPHITTINFTKVFGEALLYLLTHRGLTASIGGGRFQRLTELLKKATHTCPTAISFALSRYTTQEEIERASTLIEQCYQTLERTSVHL